MGPYNKINQIDLGFFFNNMRLCLQLPQHGLIPPPLTNLRLSVKLPEPQCQKSQSNSEPPKLEEEEEKSTTSSQKQ